MTYGGVDLYGHMDINQCISTNLKIRSQPIDKISAIGVQIMS